MSFNQVLKYLTRGMTSVIIGVTVVEVVSKCVRLTTVNKRKNK